MTGFPNKLVATQFRIKVHFHFSEHGEERRNWFGVGDDLHRRVPLEMQNVEGLNTVGMWFERAGKFGPGDTANVECAVIAPELFIGKIKPGSKGRLWDAGFFADIEVIEVDETQLEKAAKK
jgi:hypothetical protein